MIATYPGARTTSRCLGSGAHVRSRSVRVGSAVTDQTRAGVTATADAEGNSEDPVKLRSISDLPGMYPNI